MKSDLKWQGEMINKNTILRIEPGKEHFLTLGIKEDEVKKIIEQKFYRIILN